MGLDKLRKIMRKLFFILMTFCLIASQTYARAGWKTALVDAGGAWGGATSGAPYFPPYGAIVGGILCGAAASLAGYPQGDQQNFPIYNQVVLNPFNNLERIGANHNTLISKYMESSLDRSNLGSIVTNLFNFAKQYNIDTKDFTVDYIVSEVSSFMKNDLTTVDGVIALMSASIPNSIQDQVKISLTRILATNSIDEFNRISIEEENKIVVMDGLSEANVASFHAFFSTFRHSANYWGKDN